MLYETRESSCILLLKVLQLFDNGSSSFDENVYQLVYLKGQTTF